MSTTSAWDWAALRRLTCEQLRALHLHHVEDVQGTARPVWIPRPPGCRCPR